MEYAKPLIRDVKKLQENSDVGQHIDIKRMLNYKQVKYGHQFPPMENEERLDAVFFALSDNRRRRFLEELAAGPKSVGQLAAASGMKLSAASKHVAALEAGNLIYKTRHGREVRCHLHLDVWREVAGYMAMHAKFWTGRLDELENHLRETGDR